MTTPAGNRRRQRSTRVAVAVGLIAVAALVVVATVVTGSWLAVTIASFAAVACGAIAVKITHSELMASRRDAARDRAEQAKAYVDLTVTRTTENVEFAADMQGRIAKRDAVVDRLEKRLGDAAAELAEARRELSEVTERADAAEADAKRVSAQLTDAEERAGHAVVRVAELEAEVDVLRTELATVTEAWHGAENRRRRA